MKFEMLTKILDIMFVVSFHSSVKPSKMKGHVNAIHLKIQFYHCPFCLTHKSRTNYFTKHLKEKHGDKLDRLDVSAEMVRYVVGLTYRDDGMELRVRIKEAKIFIYVLDLSIYTALFRYKFIALLSCYTEGITNSPRRRSQRTSITGRWRLFWPTLGASPRLSPRS